MKKSESSVEPERGMEKGANANHRVSVKVRLSCHLVLRWLRADDSPHRRQAVAVNLI